MSSFSGNTEELSLFYDQSFHRSTNYTDTDTKDTVSSLIQSVSAYTGYIYRYSVQYCHPLTHRRSVNTDHTDIGAHCSTEAPTLSKYRHFMFLFITHQRIVVRRAHLSFPRVKCTEAAYNFEY
jgi:hypothetical protein